MLAYRGGLEMVEGRRANQLAAEIKVRNHTILAGVAEKLGGNDEGFDPHEILEAALTACTIITVQMYANRKQWKLESTDVKVKVESEGAKSVISREVTFRGELSDEEKDRLLDIANKCPIHRLLTSEITINTSEIRNDRV
jgi:putative redox protein